MSSEPIPEELKAARKRIDQIDEDLVRLLARRFEMTQQVGKLKAATRLNAVDPDREARKLESIRALSEEVGLNPQFVADIFAQIMAEVVRNHRRLQEQP